MGYYINEDSKGNALQALGKKQALLNDGAKITDCSFKENLIAIVDNGHFEAAGYMFSESEFEYFKDSPRVSAWLTHPEAKELAK